jgi:nitrite reductase/ring-hydroxylating ferredoxin subunit
MDLPDSVAAIGERLGGHDPIVVDPQLLNGADVFAAERARIFLQPWVAVDHQSRVDKPDRYVRIDAASRSILLTRDAGGQLRALRNLCIHAGYPVCEAEEGPADRLVCPYHGWEYAADGKLLEPDLSGRIDPARLRLASHPVCVQDGLVFVDLSRPAGEIAAPPISPGVVPAWLADGRVSGRARYSTSWNWKLALQFVKSTPLLFCGDRGEQLEMVAFGPLSLMAIEPDQATLLCVIPKSAAHTDLQLMRIGPADGAAPDGPDRVAEGLRAAGDAEAVAGSAKLDREFFNWYWPMMSAA